MPLPNKRLLNAITTIAANNNKPRRYRNDRYVESIRPLAESYGIAKIVPPEGWSPPPTPLTQHSRKLLPTKKQALHSLMNVRN